MEAGKMNRRSGSLLTGAFLACGLLSGSAQASFLGDSVGITEYYPTFGSVYGSPSGTQVITSGGNSFSIVGLSLDEFNIAPTTVTLIPTSAYTPSSASFNGFDVADDNPLTTITGVALASGSLGLPAGFLTFDSHDVFINVEGVDLTKPIVVDVSFAARGTPAPEPGMIALLGLALAGIGMARWRKTA
jgi:hypothetical protein